MTIALVDVPAALRPHVAQVKHLLGSFARNFSGRPHAACDRRLLGELIARLEHLGGRARDGRRVEAQAGIGGVGAGREDREQREDAHRAHRTPT